jgi:hypothetical protein
VLCGVADGHAAVDVAHRLASLFRQPPASMRALLDGQRRVLKRGLPEAAARAYLAALLQAGCRCELVTEGAPAPAPRIRPAPVAVSAPPAPTAAELAAQARQRQLALYRLGSGQHLALAAIALHGPTALLLLRLQGGTAIAAGLAVVLLMLVSQAAISRQLGYGRAARAALALAMLVPLLGLLTLIPLWRQADRALRLEGVPSGWSGARRDALSELARQAELGPQVQPPVALAVVAVLLVQLGCYGVQERSRQRLLALAQEERIRPCAMTGVWRTNSPVGPYEMTLEETGRMTLLPLTLAPDARTFRGNWQFDQEAGVLAMIDRSQPRKPSAFQRAIRPHGSSYQLARDGIWYDLQLRRRLHGSRCLFAPTSGLPKQ